MQEVPMETEMSSFNRTETTDVKSQRVQVRVLESAPQNLAERRLSPGEWLRTIEDFRAPFGFDRMPTVWG